MIEQQKLEEIKAAAGRATPGPWRPTEEYYDGPIEEVSAGDKTVCCTHTGNYPQDKHNQEYIAMCSPDVILELVAEVDRYRNLIKPLMDAVGRSDWPLATLKPGPCSCSDTSGPTWCPTHSPRA